ncbi:Hypothetical protein R9X50_00139000 [Acrodontium crateriforme]|uniref:BZIP domain-containing protein n=1 Tax=Acrodontium crateriforme TaxID=150365 RepID=A0AAQ3M1Z0_9PEZI|nr:Hypothetical protein R9X50_00139000 [Acrodontium crateriforme]
MSLDWGLGFGNNHTVTWDDRVAGTDLYGPVQVNTAENADGDLMQQIGSPWSDSLMAHQSNGQPMFPVDTPAQYSSNSGIDDNTWPDDNNTWSDHIYTNANAMDPNLQQNSTNNFQQNSTNNFHQNANDNMQRLIKQVHETQARLPMPRHDFSELFQNGNGGVGHLQYPGSFDSVMNQHSYQDMVTDDGAGQGHSRMNSNGTMLNGGTMHHMPNNDLGHGQNGMRAYQKQAAVGNPFNHLQAGPPQFTHPFVVEGTHPFAVEGMPANADDGIAPQYRHSYPGTMHSAIGGGTTDLAAAARAQRASRGRASLPTPYTSQDAPRYSRDAPVPISALPNPRNMNPGHASSSTAPVIVPATGPMQNDVTIPAKPKPGRRPMDDSGETADRRREQNRQAQRTFRDKRAQRVNDLEEELRKLKSEHQEQIANFHRQVEEQRTDIVGLRARNATLEDENKSLIKEVAQLRRQPAAGRPQAPSPDTAPDEGPAPVNYMFQPEDDHLAIDFTHKFASKRVESNAAFASPYAEATNGQKCGFCTDQQNCVCDQEEASTMTLAQPNSSVGAKAHPVPGGCDACLADPERAQACKDSYKKALQYPTFRANTGESSRILGEHTTSLPSMVTSDGMPPSKKARISCSQAIDKFAQSGQRLASISELFGSIHALPAVGSNGQGFDVEEHEAAEVLQTLHQQHMSPKAKEQ